MRWLWVVTALAVTGAWTQEPLTTEEPIVGKVQAGETVQYRLTVPAGKRGFVTLLPLDGDADLFVLLPPTMPLEKTPLKSVGVALQMERVVLPAQKQDSEAVIVVRGVTATRFFLTASWTTKQVQVSPAERKVIGVNWQEDAVSSEVVLLALTLQNKSSSWYEVTVKAVGTVAQKAALPKPFMLGPQGQRDLGWVALSSNARLDVTMERTVKADLFLVADLVSRVVAGVGLSPEVVVAIDDLLPHLKPLLPVTQALREGDWKRAGATLLTVVRRHPQVLTALHTFLKRAGVHVPRDVLSNKLALGFGAVSAIVTGIAAVKAPEKESITVTLQ